VEDPVLHTLTELWHQRKGPARRWSAAGEREKLRWNQFPFAPAVEKGEGTPRDRKGSDERTYRKHLVPWFLGTTGRDTHNDCAETWIYTRNLRILFMETSGQGV